MKREYVGFLCLAAIIALAILAEFSTVISIECGEFCTSTRPKEPYFSLGGLLIGAFAIGFPQLAPAPRASQRVELWRRSIACLIDLQCALAIGFSISDLVLRVFLYAMSGIWDLRNLNAGTHSNEILVFLSILFVFLLAYTYFLLPIKYKRATIGQYIMGYQILSDSETPKPALRPVLGYFALASTLLWIWFDSKGATEGRYWWDRATGTRAVMVNT